MQASLLYPKSNPVATVQKHYENEIDLDSRSIEEEYIMSTPKTSWPQVVGWPATAAVSPASGSGCFGFFVIPDDRANL